MSNYDQLHHAWEALSRAQQELATAVDRLSVINPDGGSEPAVITPTRFEAAYRALSRARTSGGHDYYDRWTAASQASHRRYARAVLEGAGFEVRE